MHRNRNNASTVRKFNTLETNAFWNWALNRIEIDLFKENHKIDKFYIQIEYLIVKPNLHKEAKFGIYEYNRGST